MKTMFDRAGHALEKVREPLRRFPLAYRGLALAITLVLYSAGVLAVDAISGEAIFPVALVAMYFLPAVLRAWMLLYWQLKDDVRHLREGHQSHKVA
ncbi:MAG: hypothetical protein R3300_21910 [Candidatus Promineifilaceae bacterium]|nr:hypothetical protein [Candidatus Promineifilaceae bacterium]